MSSIIQQVTTTPFSKWVPVSGCYIESQLTFPSRLNDPWLCDIVAGGCWNDKSHASQEDQKGEGTVSRAEGEQFAKKHELHVWRWANEPPFNLWHMANVCFDVPLSSVKDDSFAGCVEDEAMGTWEGPLSQDCLQVKKTQKLWQNFVLQKKNLRWIEFYSALLVPWWRWKALTKNLSLLFDICCWNNHTCLFFWCHLGITPQQHEQPVHWACQIWQLRLVFERPIFRKPFHPLSTESKRLGGQNVQTQYFLVFILN